MADAECLYIVDCIVPQPGKGKDAYHLYLSEYAPTARERGLTLCHSWVAPPVWLEGEQANTLTFIWSVLGVGDYWAAEAKARWDPATPEFWGKLEPLIQSRTRQVMAEADDIESLCNV